jgi:hypothetical protein
MACSSSSGGKARDQGNESGVSSAVPGPSTLVKGLSNPANSSGLGIVASTPEPSPRGVSGVDKAGRGLSMCEEGGGEVSIEDKEGVGTKAAP